VPTETAGAPFTQGDFRSDTVTQPTAAMREAMHRAPVGDDVYGDDPSVNLLQETLAMQAGFEAALWFPSGTQSNLAALMSHCERGDEYLVGQEAHTYRYEGGGAAVLGSIQPQPLNNEADGSIAISALVAAVKPGDAHFARTRLLTLENTISGRVLPLDYCAAALAFARGHGLSTHLDGARIFNAAIALGQPVATLCAGFDSVSICLSKGLGAPAGSVLCGSPDFIRRAHRWRKMLGGGLRQAGIFAAAGLYALDHHVTRLADDHRNAQRLGTGLTALGYTVTRCATNMVFMRAPSGFADFLRGAGFALSDAPVLRLVTHLDIGEADIEKFLEMAARFSGERAG